MTSYDTYFVTLRIEVPKDENVGPPGVWNWDAIINPHDSKEASTPVEMLDCVLYPVKELNS